MGENAAYLVPETL